MCKIIRTYKSINLSVGYLYNLPYIYIKFMHCNMHYNIPSYACITTHNTLIHYINYS